MRWRVIAGLFVLSFITIVDRVSISAAKNEMAAELGIPDLTFGVILGAFALGYALFMLPSGWLADRWGPRKFLAVTVAFWSLFTFQTGLVSAIAVLVAVRFFFGAAESGAYPTAARAIYGCLPAKERGLALGLMNTGSRLGAAVGLTAMSACIAAFGWRASFIVLGALGFGWAVWWFRWFRDNPREKRGISPAELELIGSSWSVSSDIGGRRTGTLSAAMNTFGSLGSFASSVAFPALLAWTGSIQTHFFVAAALDVAAVFCWWRIRAGSDPQP
jgi:ACS family glucarate transporter-like MFS transporter